MVEPATRVVTKLVFVTPKLVLTGIVTVACAWLFAGVGSMVPMGAVIVAWLSCVPVAPDLARSVIVTLLLTGRVSVALNCDDVVIKAVSVPPLKPVAPRSVIPNKPLGNVSFNVALVAAFGPVLRAVSVNVVVWSNNMTVGVAVLVKLKSACGPILTVTVPTLLPGLSSVTPAGAAMVAVLITAPDVPARACNTTVSVLATGKVAVPLNTLAVVTRLVSVAPLTPDAVTKVKVPMLAGNRSLSVALVTGLGPVLTKVRVKVVVWPNASDGVLATFVADKSALGPTTTVAVALLFTKLSSLAAPGGVTVATLIGAPLAVATALIKSVNV